MSAPNWYFQPWDPAVTPSDNYGVMLGIVPARMAGEFTRSSLFVEVQRAADAGAGTAPDAGTALTIGQCGPFAFTGGMYFDNTATGTVKLWYRVRHTSFNLEPGPWTTWLGSAPYAIGDRLINAWRSGQLVFPSIDGASRPVSTSLTFLVPNGEFDIWDSDQQPHGWSVDL